MRISAAHGDVNRAHSAPAERPLLAPSPHLRRVGELVRVQLNPVPDFRTMIQHTPIDRRSVLKSIGVGMAGSVVSAGPATGAPGRTRGRRNELEIVATHDHHVGEHRLELSTNEIASGWTTIELENRTENTHFVFSSKIPQQAIDDSDGFNGDLLEFWIKVVTNPFQWFMDEFLVEGKEANPDDLSDFYDGLFPPWFGDVVTYGGPGLTSSHRSSRTTVSLDEGEYIVECYVKNSNNDFHSYHGMLDLLSVTDEESGAPEPNSTVDLTLTNDGIEWEPGVRPGQHVVGVEFEENQLYPNLVGHDVHLIRFDDESDSDDVIGWMDWTNDEQLISDGTEPGTFVGGSQDILLPGEHPRAGYFHVNLTPGAYAWVAEVPDPQTHGFLEEFIVP